MRVLAIDPALRNTGYAILEMGNRSRNETHRVVDHGVIRNPARYLQSRCLVAIREQLADKIREFAPECCAIESVIYVQSFKTAITLGAARGAAILAAAEAGLEIYEYAPRRVKQAVVGRGAADKQQVAFMMRSLLGLKETPGPDAADAMAIGMTHFHAMESHEAVRNQAPRI